MCAGSSTQAVDFNDVGRPSQMTEPEKEEEDGDEEVTRTEKGGVHRGDGINANRGRLL